jgi:2,5-diketo-D-gluconate reductase B
MGYRHVDTAEMYENEREVDGGRKESGIPREDLFLTTKLWLESLTRKTVPKAADQCLKRLGTD